jgi:hypothetical protein
MSATESKAAIDKRLGEILVEKRIIAQSQLDEALERQKVQSRKFLGQILVEMGVPQDRIANTMHLYRKRKPFGQILIDLGAITPEALAMALEKQKELKTRGIRKPIGLLLIERKAITNEHYLAALSKHLAMPIASLHHFAATPDLQKSIGERYAEKVRAVVFENTAAALKVALSEPTAQILDEIRRVLSPAKRVIFHLASPGQVERCFQRMTDPFCEAR